MGEMPCITYLWKIENFSLWVTQNNQDLQSPCFQAVNNKWELILCPNAGMKGEWCRLYVRSNKESTNVQVDCELSFLAADGTVLRNHKVVGAVISESLNFICADFVPRIAIFGSQKELFLPQDVLTVRCRIWRTGMLSKQILAKTVFHRKNFYWNIENFDVVEETTTESFEIASRHFNIKLHFKNLHTRGAYANVEITKTAEAAEVVSNCKIYIMDANGKERATIHDYDSPHANLKAPWRFPIILKREDIMNGTLSLHWEFIVSVSEIFLSFFHGGSQSVYVDVQANNNPNNPSTLQKNLYDLYRHEKLCDVTLKTGNVSFLVHKSVLAARSTVFCAMFENDTEACRESIIDIPDVEHSILDRMILFLYTDSLEDVHWEEAIKLYRVANTYAIVPLKEKCQSVLKAELTVSNICDTAVLANSHQDEDLMQYIEDFVCRHDDIIYSDKWKYLEENNPQLTIKLFHAIAGNFKRRRMD